MNEDFAGKTILVTGGTSGIGKAIVEEFINGGADVIFTGRNVDAADTIIHEINEGSGRLHFFPVDFEDLSAIELLFHQVTKSFSTIDTLINCAGIWHTMTLENVSLKEYRQILDVNFGSCVFMTQKFLPLIRDKGSIINIASIGGLQSHIAGRSQYLYAASKAAMIEFSQLCALNYAEKIRVNCICPGPTDTPIYKNRQFEKIIASIPVKRMGVPEDAAKAAAFLASDDASYINGAVLTIDGGASLT